MKLFDVYYGWVLQRDKLCSKFVQSLKFCKHICKLKIWFQSFPHCNNFAWIFRSVQQKILEEFNHHLNLNKMICENPHESMRIYMNLHESTWIYVNPWESMIIYKNLWEPMSIRVDAVTPSRWASAGLYYCQARIVVLRLQVGLLLWDQSVRTSVVREPQRETSKRFHERQRRISSPS